jgi:ABC transporter substrate binding protein
LAALAPDAILAGSGTTTVAPLLQATRTVPIVFVVVIDPVGAGFVVSLARPGGNAPDGESIVEHLAGIEDYQVALATYRAACERWPGTPITLRQGARVKQPARLRLVSSSSQ